MSKMRVQTSEEENWMSETRTRTEQLLGRFSDNDYTGFDVARMNLNTVLDRLDKLMHARPVLRRERGDG